VKECNYGSLTIVLDKTMSEAEETLPRFADDLQATLDKCSNLKEVTVINIGLNGESSAFQAVAEKIKFPSLAIDEFDKATAEAKPEKECGIRAACRNRVFRELQAAFNEKYREILQNYNDKFLESLGELRLAVLKKAEKEAPYSDIDAMAQRITMLSTSHI